VMAEISAECPLARHIICGHVGRSPCILNQPCESIGIVAGGEGLTITPLQRLDVSCVAPGCWLLSFEPGRLGRILTREEGYTWYRN